VLKPHRGVTARCCRYDGLSLSRNTILYRRSPPAKKTLRRAGSLKLPSQNFLRSLTHCRNLFGFPLRSQPTSYKSQGSVVKLQGLTLYGKYVHSPVTGSGGSKGIGTLMPGLPVRREEQVEQRRRQSEEYNLTYASEEYHVERTRGPTG